MTGIDTAIRNTRRYWFEDGLTEIAAATIFAAIGLLFAFEAAAPAGSPWASVSAIGLPVIVIVGSWLGGIAVRSLKERYTYPRSGYVAYPRTSGRRRAAAGALAAIVAFVLVLVLARLGTASRQWIPAMDGMAFAAMLLYLGYGLGVRRFYALAGLALIAGLAISIRAPDEIAGSAWFFGLMGLLFAVTGVAVLIVYLRNTEPPDESAIHAVTAAGDGAS